MRLFRIQHELIADPRGAETWYRPDTGRSPSPSRWRDASGRRWPCGDGGDSRLRHAVHREEPALTMTWGRYTADLGVLQLVEAKDPSTHAFWVDFSWYGALIDRVELVRVDGGRGVVPAPDPRHRVTDFDVAVAWLVHDLEGRPEADHPGHYLDRIGAETVPDRARWG